MSMLRHSATTRSGADGHDLHDAIIVRSPKDIADWPIRRSIVGVRSTYHGGLELSFDMALPDRWKWFTGNRENPDDNFQYTVWAFVVHHGSVYGAGFIQMWQGRAMGDRSLPPILSDYGNWWNDRRLWGDMSDYVPRVGDPIGIMVSAGNARLWDGGVSSVRERSNLVVVTLAPNDEWSYSFDPGAPTPDPTPTPTPTPTPEPGGTISGEDVAKIISLLESIDESLKLLNQKV